MPSPKFPTRIPIQRHHIEPTIEALTKHSKIFGVKFFKKDGSPRTMCCRLGVSKGVTGVGKPWDRSNYPQYITVYEMGKKAQKKAEAEGKLPYRHMNLDTVQSITAKGTVFDVVD